MEVLLKAARLMTCSIRNNVERLLEASKPSPDIVEAAPSWICSLTSLMLGDTL